MTTLTADTLPKLLRHNARTLGDKVALREKRFGVWQSTTWREYGLRVREFALGLHAMGFRRGDHIAIIGDNRPEWVIAEVAAQSLGGVSIGIYQDSAASEVAYIVTRCDAKFIVVEDQEQVDKLIEIRDELTTVEKLIFYDPKGLRAYTESFLIAFPEVEAMGRALHVTQPGLYDEQVDLGRGADVAIIATTSGTTSKPKLACITHNNFLAMSEGMTAVDAFQPDHEFVSFLPLAWIGEQMISMACGMRVGFALNFPEEPDTVQMNIREMGPHIMFAPPRIWENMVSQVQVKIEDADRVKQALFRWAMRVGYRAADARFGGQSVGGADSLLTRLARVLVFDNLLDQLGLSNMRWAYTAGAALGPDIFRFFHAMGVNLKQGYGQTETTGICVLHHDDAIKFQTVGVALPGAEIRCDESGEILVRGSMTFAGYYGDADATGKTLTSDGWVRTGDAGYFDDDGHLIVIDRAKDVMTLADGTRFSPQFIENKLKFSPYVREVVVFGGDHPFVTAMINIDFSNVGKWAENHRVAYTTYTDLAQKSGVYDLIRKEVTRTNADLPPAAQIKRFLLLHKELDADDAELTRTRKVRRGFVGERYGELLAGLYGDGESVRVHTDITYQDGRKASMNVDIRIDNMDEKIKI